MYSIKLNPMKKILLASMLMCSGLGSSAQDAGNSEGRLSVDYSIDFVSRYIWRGLLYNASPNVQPTLSLNAGGFSIGSWASYSFNQNYAEIDLFVTYAKGPFSVTLFDYYNEDEADMGSVKYFTWKRKDTGHALEGSLAWNGTESLPLRLLAATFFYGNDRDENDDQFYSTYFELGYPFSINDYTLDLFVGGTPANGLYNTGANIVNVGFSLNKDIKISDNFTLPVKATFVVNPTKEDVFFVVGVTLN